MGKAELISGLLESLLQAQQRLSVFSRDTAKFPVLCVCSWRHGGQLPRASYPESSDAR